MVFWDTSKDREDELVKKAFDMITKFEMDVPAVLMLESIKPLAFVGGSLLRIALSPYFLFFGSEGHEILDTFEKRQNIEKLIKMLEEKHKQEKDKKEEAEEGGAPAKAEKKGWRRYFRF